MATNENGSSVVDWEPRDCDPELLGYLGEQARLMDGLAYHQMTVHEARATHRRVCEARRSALSDMPPVAGVVDKTLVYRSAQIPLRIYSPQVKTSSPVPVVVFFHGGGWVFGDIQSYEETARMICALSQVVVVSVGYLLAPEHQFPEPLMSCIEAVRWTKQHIGSHQGDPDSVVLMGDSAGGNLSAATALECRRRGLGVVGQVVAYGPLVHIGQTDAAGVKPWSERRQRFGPTYASTAWYWSNYVGEPERGGDPRASVLLDSDMASAPPAVIVAGSLDTYAEECFRYADLLRDSGVAVRVREYPALTHGFINHGWMRAGVRSEKAHAAAVELCGDVRELAYAGRIKELR